MALHLLSPLMAIGPEVIALGVLGLIVLIWVIGTYNGLVRTRNHTDESWSGVDTELKRRYDLIPNLVSTARGYASHEETVFREVTEARTRALESTGPPDSQAGAERQLVARLTGLLALAESYPDLKADQQFLALQEELVNTEDRLAAARRFYNGNVRTMNALCETFPSNFVARLGSFKHESFFEVEPSIRDETPQV